MVLHHHLLARDRPLHRKVIDTPFQNRPKKMQRMTRAKMMVGLSSATMSSISMPMATGDYHVMENDRTSKPGQEEKLNFKPMLSLIVKVCSQENA